MTTDDRDDALVLEQVRAGKRRAADMQIELGWPPLGQRCRRLDKALRRLAAGRKIEHARDGWRERETKPNGGRTTCPINITAPPLLLGVLRAQARSRAGGGTPKLGETIYALARGTAPPLSSRLWAEAERVALTATGEPADIARAVEDRILAMLTAPNHNEVT